MGMGGDEVGGVGDDAGEVAAATGTGHLPGKDIRHGGIGVDIFLNTALDHGGEHGHLGIICSAGISGNCFLTISTYFALVTTQKFCLGQTPLKRSTVSCIKVRPQPNISMNCLGYSGVLSGQKRLPTPPAIITIWLFRIVEILTRLHFYKNCVFIVDNCIRALTEEGEDLFLPDFLP